MLRNIGKSRFDPESKCAYTEDPNQVIVGETVVTEETHRRSPATRSYNQAQTRSLFERAELSNVRLYSEFTFEPVQLDDTMFVVQENRRSEVLGIGLSIIFSAGQ